MTLTSTRVTGSQTDTLPKVKRRPISKKELAASAGAYVGSDVMFIVPTGLLRPGFTPKPADVVTDQDGSFTCLDAAGSRLDASGTYQTWRLTTRNLAIHYDLQDLITIETPTIGYDAGGVPVKVWNALYTNLQAKVQLVTQEIVDELGIRGFLGTHAIYVAKQLAWGEAFLLNRVKWTSRDDGKTRYLDIKDVHDPKMIDRLPVIDAWLHP